MPPIRPAGSAVNARPRVRLAGPFGPARKKTAQPLGSIASKIMSIIATFAPGRRCPMVIAWRRRVLLNNIRYRRSETTCFLSRESLWAVLRRIIGRLEYSLLLGNTIMSVVGT